MKGIKNIVLRYIVSAAFISILLLIANLIILTLWGSYSQSSSNHKYSISSISQGLKKQGNTFKLCNESKSSIENNFKWAMLLDDSGKVIWSKNLPDDVPLIYTSSDIASFSRWYLNSYPVKTWHHKNGLFVLGDNKNSTWKYNFEAPQKSMFNFPKWLLAGIIINFLIAILLAFLFGIRFFNSISSIAKALEAMSKKKQVFLKLKGPFISLGNNINRTSKELLRQQSLIEKRDTARNNWINSISHDIRTPLSIIMGYSSSLENSTNFCKEEIHKSSIIRLQSEKIKQLIQDLNLTVKLEYEMQPLNIHPFFISELTRKIVVSYLNNFYDNKYSIELSISNESQSLKINGDVRLFERAFTNIIGNCMKYNENGCDIFIEIKRQDDFCIIEIKDNGIGFNDEVLETLNTSNKFPSGESHGLGLFIVKQIAKVHGGKTDFKNWNNGSCITLYIPWI